MKTMTTMLLAGLLVGGLTLPIVVAVGQEEKPCTRAPSDAYITHPLHGESYLYLDVTQPGKVGEWVEHNGATGLQTVDCFEFGFLRFRADIHEELLG